MRIRVARSLHDLHAAVAGDGAAVVRLVRNGEELGPDRARADAILIVDQLSTTEHSTLREVPPWIYLGSRQHLPRTRGCGTGSLDIDAEWLAWHLPARPARVSRIRVWVTLDQSFTINVESWEGRRQAAGTVATKQRSGRTLDRLDCAANRMKRVADASVVCHDQSVLWRTSAAILASEADPEAVDPLGELLREQARALLPVLAGIEESPRRLLRRRHRPVRLSKVREVDAKTIRWLCKQAGRSTAERCGPRQKMVTPERYATTDTLENRVVVAYAALYDTEAKAWLAERGDMSHGAELVRSMQHRARRVADGLRLQGARQAPAHEAATTTHRSFALRHDERYRRVLVAWLDLLRQEQRAEQQWIWQGLTRRDEAQATICAMLGECAPLVVASGPLAIRRDAPAQGRHWTNDGPSLVLRVGKHASVSLTVATDDRCMIGAIATVLGPGPALHVIASDRADWIGRARRERLVTLPTNTGAKNWRIWTRKLLERAAAPTLGSVPKGTKLAPEPPLGRLRRSGSRSGIVSLDLRSSFSRLGREDPTGSVDVRFLGTALRARRIGEATEVAAQARTQPTTGSASYVPLGDVETMDFANELVSSAVRRLMGDDPLAVAIVPDTGLRAGERQRRVADGLSDALGPHRRCLLVWRSVAVTEGHRLTGGAPGDYLIVQLDDQVALTHTRLRPWPRAEVPLLVERMTRGSAVATGREAPWPRRLRTAEAAWSRTGVNVDDLKMQTDVLHLDAARVKPHMGSTSTFLFTRGEAAPIRRRHSPNARPIGVDESLVATIQALSERTGCGQILVESPIPGWSDAGAREIGTALPGCTVLAVDPEQTLRGAWEIGRRLDEGDVCWLDHVESLGIAVSAPPKGVALEKCERDRNGCWWLRLIGEDEALEAGRGLWTTPAQHVALLSIQPGEWRVPVKLRRRLEGQWQEGFLAGTGNEQRCHEVEIDRNALHGGYTRLEPRVRVRPLGGEPQLVLYHHPYGLDGREIATHPAILRVSDPD